MTNLYKQLMYNVYVNQSGIKKIVVQIAVITFEIYLKIIRRWFNILNIYKKGE